MTRAEQSSAKAGGNRQHPTARQAREIMLGLADAERARQLGRYFKTGEGEYGENDRFHGIRVPDTRKVARQLKSMPLPEIIVLLQSGMHEERLLALIILARRFERSDEATRHEIYQLYMNHRRWINNWDLVDTSAPRIVGGWLMDKDKVTLFELALSDSVWDRRIAILATAWFIAKGEFETTLRLAGMLLNDPHDLIHKGVGWMLREIGKRDEKVLRQFLDGHCRVMPRTMLRYAIEKLDEPLRQAYLKGTPPTSH